MRNTLLFVIATLLLLAGAWWQYQLVQNLTSPLPVEPAPSQQPKSDESIQKRTLPELSEEQSAFKTEQQDVVDIVGFDPENPDTQPAWTLADSNDIQLNRPALENLHIGDLISLPMPDGETYTAIVQQRKHSKSGTLHLKGQLEAYGEQFPVLLAQSGQKIFGTISTPSGIYELDTKGGVTTLTATAKLQKMYPAHNSDMMPTPKPPKSDAHQDD